ncbi:MAG TPA: serine/threonine-protein kinase [Rubrivivax sp.]|nr:serine/threonine-protein kinase [Rubrivivax sp.]
MRHHLEPGAVVAGHRLLRPIADGASSRVFVAQSPAEGGGLVALKLVPLLQGAGAAAAEAAFQGAAATARGLCHPAIVAVHGAGVEDGFGWLAMELISGADLGNHTQPAHRLPAGHVLLAAERVAQALAYAHRQGVVHRDLKPANVLADWTSHTVKLADFGLARAGDGQQTGTGLVPGTPYFMAPEQLAGGPPTPQSDFYALGVMLFQLLAGRLPFEGHSMGELLRQAVHEPAPALAPLRPDLPSELTPLVALLLAKRPEHRPADGEALAADLRSIRQAFAPSADLG